MPDVLRNIYLVCIIVGIAVPLLNVILGAIGGIFDFDLDFDSADGLDSVFPISTHTLSFSAVVFGALGRLLLFLLPDSLPWLSLVIALPLGLVAGLLLHRFVIRPLRSNHPRANDIRDLRWKEGTVKLELRQDFIGSITVLSATGSLVTYSAKPVNWVSVIPVGAKVMVVEVDEEKSLCIVSPLEEASSYFEHTSNQ
ncbi:MAG: hypothetical protein ACK5LX_12240 [Oscillospiraceae bacterium]